MHVKAMPARALNVVSRLHGWSYGSGALHERLAADLRRLIETGELEPLTQLPSERALAQSIAVGRGTVAAAYDLLRSAGLVSSKQGSGTWVAGEQHRSGQVGRETVLFPWLHRIDTSGPSDNRSRDIVDLSAVVTAAAAPVVQEMAALNRSDLTTLAGIQEYIPVGLWLLREQIAGQFTDRGILTTADQIVVTTGAQQALNLVVSTLVPRRGRVVLEDPTYPGALPIFRGQGAQLVPVPLDEGGARFDRVEDAIIQLRPCLLYLNPTHHNPTGTIMPESRRRQLAEFASSRNVTVVEGAVLEDLSCETSLPPPSMAAYCDESVLTIGSMSPLFWTGLRVGWIRGPGRMIARLARSKAVADLGGSLLDQFIAARLLHRQKEVREIRSRELLHRRDLLSEAITHLLPQLTWKKPLGGPALWVEIPWGSATGLAQMALRFGVAILPGPAFSPSGSHDNRFRLPYVAADDVLLKGVVRLAEAWDAYSSSAAHRAGPESLLRGQKADHF